MSAATSAGTAVAARLQVRNLSCGMALVGVQLMRPGDERTLAMRCPTAQSLYLSAMQSRP